jgi:phage shock protein PspC (stress-responsive transcriptional regulator)
MSASHFTAMNATTPGTATTWTRLQDLTLPHKDRMVGGVCAAFGAATPIPAWMWRVGFCACTLAWGGGIAAYVVLMVCIPEEPSGGHSR